MRAIGCLLHLLRALAPGLLVSSWTPGAHAVMYKWLDENGSVTYSNEPPADPARVRDLTRIEDLSPDLGKRTGDTAALTANVAREANAFAPTAADTRTPHEKPSRAEQRTADAPPATVQRIQAGAVLDPCLTSADPLCHEKNRHNYHPYLGYAPSPSNAVGASASGGAGGALSGRVVTPAKNRSSVR